MKKLMMAFLLMSTTILAGCSFFGKKVTTTDTVSDTNTATTSTGQVMAEAVKGKYNFGDENCNKYVKLMECLLDKTPDTAKEQTVRSFEKVMDLWNGMEKDALPETCKNTINMLQDQKEVFQKA